MLLPMTIGLLLCAALQPLINHEVSLHPKYLLQVLLNHGGVTILSYSLFWHCNTFLLHLYRWWRHVLLFLLFQLCEQAMKIATLGRCVTLDFEFPPNCVFLRGLIINSEGR